MLVGAVFAPFILSWVDLGPQLAPKKALVASLVGAGIGLTAYLGVGICVIGAALYRDAAANRARRANSLNHPSPEFCV